MIANDRLITVLEFADTRLQMIHIFHSTFYNVVGHRFLLLPIFEVIARIVVAFSYTKRQLSISWELLYVIAVFIC